MRYNFLTSAGKVVDWARGLVTALTQRDVALEERLKGIEARLTDAEDRLTAGGL